MTEERKEANEEGVTEWAAAMPPWGSDSLGTLRGPMETTTQNYPLAGEFIHQCLSLIGSTLPLQVRKSPVLPNCSVHRLSKLLWSQHWWGPKPSASLKQQRQNHEMETVIVPLEVSTKTEMNSEVSSGDMGRAACLL